MTVCKDYVACTEHRIVAHRLTPYLLGNGYLGRFALDKDYRSKVGTHNHYIGTLSRTIDSYGVLLRNRLRQHTTV